MIKKLKKFFFLLFKPKVLKILLSTYYHGYLKEVGWFNSFELGMPVDANNNPLPWCSYPYINFIESRLSDYMEIFEFGSGNSTLYYAKRVKRVVTEEHDLIWYEKMKSIIPDNVELFCKKLDYGGEYSTFIQSLGKKFHMIIIDGRDRVNCIKNSIECLVEDGVIVLDDSERQEYKEGVDFLIIHGFKRIDLEGISPGFFYKKCTTIFYREKNCLGI